MDFKVNINMGVRVKLTDLGVSILKERHDELNRAVKDLGGRGIGEFELRSDEDGYYHSQLWVIMSIFGPHMKMTSDMLFNADIIIENGEEYHKRPVKGVKPHSIIIDEFMEADIRKDITDLGFSEKVADEYLNLTEEDFKHESKDTSSAQPK